MDRSDLPFYYLIFSGYAGFRAYERTYDHYKKDNIYSVDYVSYLNFFDIDFRNCFPSDHAG